MPCFSYGYHTGGIAPFVREEVRGNKASQHGAHLEWKNRQVLPDGKGHGPLRPLSGPEAVPMTTMLNRL